MGRATKKIEFSLDCELLWGMKKGVSSHYIENNVSKSQVSLKEILSSWNPDGSNIYLAFVGKSLPMFEVDSNDRSYLSEIGYEKYLSKSYLKFSSFDFKPKQENVKFGLHSIAHKFYTDLNDDEKKLEIDTITDFVKDKDEFRSIFVYPKNLADNESVNKYKEEFDIIRVNSRSWLYKTTDKGVSKTKRILRFLDSFFPVFELFCDKKPEHEIKNAVVGTHFFRANLPNYLLYLHYFRLKLGSLIMRFFNHKMHIWSHPHNFGGNPVAIKLFCGLSK